MLLQETVQAFRICKRPYPEVEFRLQYCYTNDIVGTLGSGYTITTYIVEQRLRTIVHMALWCRTPTSVH